MTPTSASGVHWKCVHKFLDYCIDRALEDKKDNVPPTMNQDGKQTSSHQYQSLLDGVAELTNDRMEICNQIIQGMMAAQDMTAVLISNTFFLLSRSRVPAGRNSFCRLSATDAEGYDDVTGPASAADVASQTEERFK